MVWIVHRHVVNGIDRGAIAETPAYTNFYHLFSDYSLAAFFFMSGLFIAGAVRRPFREFVINRAMTGVYAYALWVVLYWTMQTALAGETNNDATIDRLLWMWLRPPWHFWFIYALILISFVYVIFRKLGLPDWAIVVIALAANLAQPYLAAIPWSGVRYICDFMIYYAVAAWMGRDSAIRWLSEAPTRTVALIMVSAAACAAFGTWLGFKDVESLLILVSPFGVVALICVACLLQRYHWLTVFRWIGRHSLEVYLLHVFGTAGARIILVRVFGVHQEHHLIHFVVGLVAGVAGPIAFAVAMERLRFPYFFTLIPKTPRPRVAESVSPA